MKFIDFSKTGFLVAKESSFLGTGFALII